MIGIFIVPVELVGCDFQGHLGVGCLVFQIQKLQRWHRNNNQNHDRNSCPDDFQQCVMGRFGWFRIVFGTETPHDVDHQGGHENGDDNDDNQKKIMKIVNLFHHGCDSSLKTCLPGHRLGGQGSGRKACNRSYSSANSGNFITERHDPFRLLVIRRNIMRQTNRSMVPDASAQFRHLCIKVPVIVGQTPPPTSMD